VFRQKVIMKNKYTILKQLLDLYEDYEESSSDLDVLDFAHWIINRLHEDPDLNKSVSRSSPGSTFPFKSQLDEKTRFLEVTARIARYHEFYIRKFLKDMVINTRLEFLFLQCVNIMGKAKKTDLINIFHLEYTTGMDTIRRLVNNGLLSKVQDESDKRIKLLIMTGSGKSVYEQSRKRIQDESTLFFTAINDNKWKKALPVLEQIDDLHNTVYQKHSNKSTAELLNLMDSLKHLLK
jgi:DNA-binding MarR family transcriptional regulator